MTEKEKYLAWEKDARENRGLVETHFTLNPNITDINSELEEEIYKELNHWNEQIDSGKIKPRIQCGFNEEEIYKELNEINKAIAEGKYEEIKNL